MALVAAQQPIPPAQPIDALVDTGADCTTVDPSVVRALNLQPTGSVSIITPSTGSTPYQTDEYDVGLYLPGPTAPALVFPTIPVITAHLWHAQGFHALIGRDILDRCLFVYNGDMQLFTLAY
jgi:aspartyl protease